VSPADADVRSTVTRPVAVARPRARRGFAWAPAVAGVTVALALLYGPVLRDLVRVWLNVPYYSHGFLVAPWSLWLILSARSRVTAHPFHRDPLGLAIAVGGLAMLAFAHALDSLTLAALSLPVVLGGLGRFALGREGFRPLVFPVASLALMAPLPSSVLPSLSWWLQHLAASFTSVVLTVMDIPFSRDGVFIHLESAIVHISEACNGLRFLMAMLVLGVAFGWAAGRGVADRLFVVGLALAAAIVGNLVRVSGTTVLVHFWGPPAALGLFHNLFGKAVYLGIGGLFFLVVLRLRSRE
jgi:exosortase